MSTFPVDMTLSVFRNIRLYTDYYDQPLMEEACYEVVAQASPYEDASSIDLDLDRVVLGPMNEWLQNRADPAYQETLLGTSHMLSFLLKQQLGLPDSWHAKCDIAKKTRDDPEPKAVLVNPVIHFPRELLRNKSAMSSQYIAYMALSGLEYNHPRWYFNYRVIPTRFGEQDLVARYI